MNDLETVDWADYEDHVAELLVARESAELAVSNRLEKSDLHGASIASLLAAMSSLALGDRTKFHSYVLQATFLAEAEIIFDAESILQEVAETSLMPHDSKTEIAVPEYFKENPEVQQYIAEAKEMQHTVYGWKRNMFWMEGIKTSVRETIEKANATLQTESLSTDSEINEALRDALTEISEYTAHVPSHWDKTALLKLGQEIASRLRLDTDIDDVVPAVEAYAILATATLGVSGNTLSILNQSAKAFGHLSKRFGNETRIAIDDDTDLEEYCLMYLRLIRQARRQIISRSAYLPVKWIANDRYLAGAARSTDGERTRPNRKTQRVAADLLDNSQLTT